MHGKLGDKARLNHILDAIIEIESYLVNTDFEDFLKNSMMRFACIKQMEIIGEACNYLSKDIVLKFAEIEWAQIVGMRKVFVHEYFGIDNTLVWQIIKSDISSLKAKISIILNTLK